MSAADFDVRYFHDGFEKRLAAMGSDGTYVRPTKCTGFKLVHQGVAEEPFFYLEGKKYNLEGTNQLDWELLRERALLGYRKTLTFRIGVWTLTVKYEDDVQVLSMKGPGSHWVAVSGLAEAVSGFQLES